jgi:hypothetical protein
LTIIIIFSILAIENHFIFKKKLFWRNFASRKKLERTKWSFHSVTQSLAYEVQLLNSAFFGNLTFSQGGHHP